MLSVDNNVNNVSKVSGTCFGNFEKSTQIDPKMFIFGPPDGCLTRAIGSIKASCLSACHVKRRRFITSTTGKVTENPLNCPHPR